MKVKVKFYGAAREVGRSCIVIESKEGTRLLLDAGVKLGGEDQFPVLEDEELAKIDAILVTHAHLDHVGYLPHIYSSGYNGFVYTLKPTFELTNVLISDYMKISNPQNVSKEGLNKLQKHFKLVEYHNEFNIKELKIRFLPAGHILGSAMIEIIDGESRMLYTGDINLRSTKLLNPAYTEKLHVDTLITESTYSADADIFPPERVVLGDIVASIKETINAGGKVIIPSFAVGRAQEVLFILDDYMKSGMIPKVPIYLDGMINKAMRIHRHNVIYCKEELQKRILMNEDDPFKSKHFNEVNTKQDRSKVMKEEGSSIIVTTSGMITGGPVMKYIERLGSDEKNKMILVGYQAEGTKGRALSDGAKELVINEKKVPINLKVEQYHLSAHADRQQLMSFIGKVNGLKNIFVVHGEPKKQLEFLEALKHKYNAVMPVPKEEYTF